MFNFGAYTIKSEFELQTLFLVSETRVAFYSSTQISRIMPEESKNESFSYVFETSSPSEIVGYDRANQLMIMQMFKIRCHCSFLLQSVHASFQLKQSKNLGENMLPMFCILANM